MFRNYTWECQACGGYFDRMVKYPEANEAPRELGDVEDEDTLCPLCGGDAVDAQRCISLPAEYHGEKDLSPRVAGGSYDTMGMKQVKRPDEIGTMPDHASYEQARSFVNRPIYKEWKAEERANRSENKAKQKRAAAKARGENINFRRDKLPGDPKVTS
jgi:hypothetical protein